MSREIKFRGQAVGGNGRWVYGNSLVQWGSGQAISNDIAPNHLHDRQGLYTEVVHVGQYTGLTDRNDKEIYEGDIVLVEGQYCEVVYDAPFFGFKDNKWGFRFINESHMETYEVVGNIHQNKELLSD